MQEDFSEYNGEGTELRKAQNRMLEILVEFDRICKKNDIEYYISYGTCLGAIRHQGFIPWDDDIDIEMLHTDYKRLIKILPVELPNWLFMQTAKTDNNFYRLYMKIVDKNSKGEYPDGDNNRKKIKFKGLSIDIFPIKRTFSYKINKFIDRYYKPAFMIHRTKNAGFFKRLLAIVILPFLFFISYLLSFIDSVFSKDKITHVYGTGLTPKLKYSDLFPTKPIQFEGYTLSGPANPHGYLTSVYGNYMDIPPKDKREIHFQTITIFNSDK